MERKGEHPMRCRVGAFHRPCRARSRAPFRSFVSDMSNVYKLVLVGVGGVGKSCLTIQVSSAYDAHKGIYLAFEVATAIETKWSGLAFLPPHTTF